MQGRFCFDSNDLFPTVDRSDTGCVTMGQVRQHHADPGRFNGYT
ncbi:hypothetical protein [Rhizobium lusitanum]|uniref:Uncharacterized protein n=1 Tax=Rhizobium lusitanum TaxID=293958 RepID=A0A7X0IWD7_9HYPH|nr:hypothetical protein [Rhizobium lusitanum]MBB6486931.1 hypothetical protein [Rhizobium lusitanum]